MKKILNAAMQYGDWDEASIKFPNGLMIQWGICHSVKPINIVMGNGFRESEQWSFRLPFKSGTVPSVLVSSSNYVDVGVGTTTATTFNTTYTSMDKNRQVGTFPYLAIGKYK